MVSDCSRPTWRSGSAAATGSDRNSEWEIERFGISIEQLQLFPGYKTIVVTQRQYGHHSEQMALENARARVYGEGERVIRVVR